MRLSGHRVPRRRARIRDVVATDTACPYRTRPILLPVPEAFESRSLPNASSHDASSLRSGCPSQRLCVDFDPYVGRIRDLSNLVQQFARHLELGALRGGGRVEADTLRFACLRGRDPIEAELERDSLRDTADRERALDQPLVAGLAYPLPLIRDGGEVLGVKEVGALDVGVAVRVLGGERVRVNRYVHAAFRGIVRDHDRSR